MEDDTVGGQQGNLLLELQREGQAAGRAGGGRAVAAAVAKAGGGAPEAAAGGRGKTEAGGAADASKRGPGAEGGASEGDTVEVSRAALHVLICTSQSVMCLVCVALLLCCIHSLYSYPPIPTLLSPLGCC